MHMLFHFFSQPLIIRQRKSLVKANARFTNLPRSLRKASQAPQMKITIINGDYGQTLVCHSVTTLQGSPCQKANRRWFPQLWIGCYKYQQECVLFRNNSQINRRLIKALISYTQKNSMHNLKRKQKQKP